MPTRKSNGRRKYGAKSRTKVGRAMSEMKEGKLRSGRSGKRVTSPKQPVAIGLSEAQRSGAKVPRKRKSSSSRGRKTSRTRSHASR